MSVQSLGQGRSGAGGGEGVGKGVSLGSFQGCLGNAGKQPSRKSAIGEGEGVENSPLPALHKPRGSVGMPAPQTPPEAQKLGLAKKRRKC